MPSDQYYQDIRDGNDLDRIKASVTLGLTAWEWVVENLPKSDGITQDIHAAARERLKRLLPNLMTEKLR